MKKKKVTVVLPNPFPDFLRWLPNSHLIQYYCRHEANASAIINEADLIFCLDFNGLSRLQEMQGVVARAKADKIIIDHHIDPDTKVAKIEVEFHNTAAGYEHVFTYTDEKYVGETSALFHEHPQIPTDAPAGEYHIHFTVTDAAGNSTTEEAEGIQITKE